MLASLQCFNNICIKFEIFNWFIFEQKDFYLDGSQAVILACLSALTWILSFSELSSAMLKSQFIRTPSVAFHLDLSQFWVEQVTKSKFLGPHKRAIQFQRSTSLQGPHHHFLKLFCSAESLMNLYISWDNSLTNQFYIYVNCFTSL